MITISSKICDVLLFIKYRYITFILSKDINLFTVYNSSEIYRNT